jgi:glutamate formiminotransferase
MYLIECVPNFSEGRNREVIVQVCASIERVAGARVLDVHVDADHNRSVITFVAAPRAIAEAALCAVACAAELIDISRHTGEHPRMGATDVLPFIPLYDVTMADCARLAHETGKRIARELGIPVYFYGEAARRPARRNLEDVRRGGYERLREEIDERPERMPDEFTGESPRIHKTAGATIVGAREILVAYNVNLRTDDLSIARDIARAVRARDGGLAKVKALGLRLHSRGIVQVSMNLIDYRVTPVHEAFAAVEREAQKRGIEIASSEIVGLLPRAALDPAFIPAVRMEQDAADCLLEDRIAAVLPEDES